MNSRWRVDGGLWRLIKAVLAAQHKTSRRTVARGKTQEISVGDQVTTYVSPVMGQAMQASIAANVAQTHAISAAADMQEESIQGRYEWR